jgi:hypothetical protein
MTKSLEQLKMEKDRQVAELNAELATTRDKLIQRELFLAIQVFVSLANSCDVRFGPFVLPQIHTCKSCSVADL